MVFARRSTKPEPDLAQMRGEWRYEPTWPAERLAERPLELDKASAAPPATAPTPSRSRAATSAGPGGSPARAISRTVSRRTSDPTRLWSLVYDWAPLEDELDILGYPFLDVTVTSSAPVAYLSAKLCDAFPDGTCALVSRGMLNLAHRDSREDPSPLEPGVPTRVRIPLEVTSWTFDAGHRIRLDLAGSDWPNAWPPPEPLSLTIDRASAVLTLPVMDGPSPVTERPVFAPPQPEIHAEPPGDRPEGVLVWRMEHDVLGRETRAVTETSGWTEADGDAPRMYERYAGVTAVSTTDPGVARAEGAAELVIEWPEATASANTTCTVSSDRDAYRLEIHLSVAEDGQERWSRDWTRTFPRDHQ